MEAEELAILPGREELSAMRYVNQYRREGRYEAIILDCAPTAEAAEPHLNCLCMGMGP